MFSVPFSQLLSSLLLAHVQSLSIKPVSCDTEVDADPFKGDTTGCFAGDVRCGFIGNGLSEISLAGFLMG
jgi:hypothetical protein